MRRHEGSIIIELSSAGTAAYPLNKGVAHMADRSKMYKEIEARRKNAKMATALYGLGYMVALGCYFISAAAMIFSLYSVMPAMSALSVLRFMRYLSEEQSPPVTLTSEW